MSLNGLKGKSYAIFKYNVMWDQRRDTVKNIKKKK